ncbi:hypothetical protein [Streptomyces sp. NPDC001480]|uniref:hypothetical protein n=1 Tax=Streptomyces sp. NPDC001480 TaxID=3364577 RepID=UPI00367D0E85
MTSVPETPVRPAAVPGDALVLAKRPLRDDVVLEETSRYADDMWVLTPAWLRADRKLFRLDFTVLPTPLVDVTKHLFYALLTQDMPPGELPLAIESIRTYYGCVRRFLLWVHACGRTLGQVTGEDLDDYHREVTFLRLSGTATRCHRRAVRMLWVYRTGCLITSGRTRCAVRPGRHGRVLTAEPLARTSPTESPSRSWARC